MVNYRAADVLNAKGANGLVVASSFSGCGGSSIGWSLAGFDTRYACEFDTHAADCYESLFPTEVDRRSIALVTGDDIIEACNGVPDVWEGSPPCSKFSNSGQRTKSWNRVTKSDQSDQDVANVEDLFFEWTRILGELKPRVAVAENVRGMTTGTVRGQLIEVLERIRSMNYDATVWQLEASRYMVPQVRRRIFVVAWDPERTAGKPELPTPYGEVVTASAAFKGLNTIVRDIEPNHETDHNVAPDLSRYKVAKTAASLQVGRRHTQRFTLGIAAPDRPWPTVSSLEMSSPGLAGPLHWDHPPYRKLSIREVQRISAFPDDYPWPEDTTWAQAGARLGNVVPPLLARAVAQSIEKVLR